MKPHEMLALRKGQLKDIREMIRNSDPASGISLSVRPGPLELGFDDGNGHPWTTLEISGDERNVILKFVETSILYSIGFYTRLTKQDIEAAQAELMKL